MAVEAPSPFSLVLVTVMKGITYRETEPAVWQSLLELQSRVREHLGALGLDLVIDEAEGYAFLRQRSGETEAGLPRLIARRPLSYPVSLLLTLLRKKMAERDAVSGETRLIVNRDEIVELVRVFLPDSANEARVIDRIDTHIMKVVELGFLRRLRGRDDAFEVRRVLKAFVDAQWLNELEQRLQAYRSHALAAEGEDDT